MRQVTKLMIKEYKIEKLGFDFMGYELNRNDILTFHHLIVPRRNCKKEGLGEGYLKWNGAIIQSIPHAYLHVIESRDLDMFNYITSEMIDENIKGRLDIENIKNIYDVLEQFEREHSGDRTKKGKVLIKEEYTRRMKNW